MTGLYRKWANRLKVGALLRGRDLLIIFLRPFSLVSRVWISCWKKTERRTSLLSTVYSRGWKTDWRNFAPTSPDTLNSRANASSSIRRKTQSWSKNCSTSRCGLEGGLSKFSVFGFLGGMSCHCQQYATVLKKIQAVRGFSERVGRGGWSTSDMPCWPLRLTPVPPQCAQYGWKELDHIKDRSLSLTPISLELYRKSWIR